MTIGAPMALVTVLMESSVGENIILAARSQRTQKNAPQKNEAGQTVYVFELRDGLQWSDGSPLTAADFVYAWNRVLAMEDADERYLLSCIDGFDAGALNIAASEDGKTLTVVLAEDVPYFLRLLANPVFLPVRQAAVESGEAWDSAAETFVCSGAYRIADLSDAGMTLTKNPYYWDADNVVTDTLRLDFSDDPAAAVQVFLAGRYALLGTLPTEQLAALREQYADAYCVSDRLGTYSLCFNLNDPALAGFTEAERVQLRTALGLLIDRNYICDDIAKSGQLPASAYIPGGISDADGRDFASHNGPDGSGGGYYSTAPEDYESNCRRALQLLRSVAGSSGAFTVSDSGICEGFPTLSFLTSDSAGHMNIASYLHSLYAQYGITLTVDAPDLAAFLQKREEGNYSIVRHSWTADYDDPYSFLALWSTGAGSNLVGFGRGAHADYAGYSATIGGEERTGLTWAEAYDALLYTAESTSDTGERYRRMHEAETLLMRTGAICPLYSYTTVYLCSSDFQGVFTGPTAAKYLMFAYETET